MFGSNIDNPEGGAPPILNRWSFKQLSMRPAKVSPRVPDESLRVMGIESGGEVNESYP
eukprot:CAMPEP_0171650800 /NCGR_PEP_ID=MMETSP0990-20121206/37876_1 /TAXON_ID=483369 /ORGANISM="non described non described, Strain CCMP2098" /LENGTH=57 /DNA_ID=CAMNT_0012229501 /DNA_START=30 /DNA_END=203 /DNA_ORIENTATION=-